MPVSRVGAVSEIVSSSACGSEEIAANVIAPLVKRSACWTATGATIAAVLPRAGKKWSRRVSFSSSTCVTGRRPLKRGSSAPMASLRDVPRPANALP